MSQAKTIEPRGFTQAVADIKLAILQARARAAQNVNVEALKLYFYVGAYVSKKTRRAKWGSGAIDALSARLQAELPGLRGFSASSIKRMRVFFEVWSKTFQIQQAVPDKYGQAHNSQFVSDEIRPMALVETELAPIRPMTLNEFGVDVVKSFLSLGFSFHVTILEKTKSEDERLYYVVRAAREFWSHAELVAHLRANDYHHIGKLPNNFEKTLSPMGLATRAVKSFRDEYLLELVNVDNVDVVKDEDIDERVLSKSLVANIEKTICTLGGDDFCLLCEKMNKGVVEFAVRDKSKPLGIATYQTLRSIPKPYKALAPVIEGVKRVLAENHKKT